MPPNPSAVHIHGSALGSHPRQHAARVEVGLSRVHDGAAGAIPFRNDGKALRPSHKRRHSLPCARHGTTAERKSSGHARKRRGNTARQATKPCTQTSTNNQRGKQRTRFLQRSPPLDRQCGGGKIAGGPWPRVARKPGVLTPLVHCDHLRSWHCVLSLARARDASAHHPPRGRDARPSRRPPSPGAILCRHSESTQDRPSAGPLHSASDRRPRPDPHALSHTS